MRRSHLGFPHALLIAAALALASGCNTFDPDLGAVPFRCGATEPRCPLGYACVSYSAEEQLCERIDSGGGQPDGGSVSCDNDGGLEPNDSPSQATNTFIPSMRDIYRAVGLAICPDTDQDYFLFQVVEGGKNLRADLTFPSAQGQLILEVLNGESSVISTGQTVTDMPDLVRAEVPNMPQGTYYVRVRSPEGVQNSYTIDIAVSGG
jgi:hypothetical protein